MVKIYLDLDEKAANEVAEDVRRNGKDGNYIVEIDAKTNSNVTLSWTIFAFELTDDGTITGAYRLYTVWLELDKPSEFHVNLVEEGDATK